jgi:endoglucanase
MMALLMNLGIGSVYAITPWLHTEGNVIKDTVGNTVVLRGVDIVDLGAVELWYGGANNLIDRITNQNDPQGSSPGWYTKVIRISCYPPDAEDFVDSPWHWAPGDDTFYNNLLRPAVDYCKTKDVYVIINLHYVANTFNHIDMANQFWTYMAPKFANDSHVIFELFCEPINNASDDVTNWLSVRTDMQNWYNIVRTYAPYNLILVGAPAYSTDIGPAADYPLTGNNIAMVTHIYPMHWQKSPAGNNWYTQNIDKCLTMYPVFMSEWGFWSKKGDQIGYGSISNYGQPLENFREARKISSSAWVASYDWMPPMFNTDWTLRVGQFEMGGFTKDMLYALRNNDQPGTVDVTPPIPCTGLIVTGTGNQSVTLNWDDNPASDLAGYNVYRSTTSGSGYVKVNGTLLSTSAYTDNSVSSGTTYYYVVTAVDIHSNESDDSAQVSATPSASNVTAYNFIGVNQANTNFNAYACKVPVFPFGGNANNRVQMVEAVDSEYVSIAANDLQRWITFNPYNGYQIFCWVEMKVNETPGTITKLDFKFIGHSTGRKAAVHRIFALKAGADWTQNASWTQAGSDQSISNTTDATMTGSITTNASSYVDSSGKITWGVYETSAAAQMYINYLELGVTH